MRLKTGDTINDLKLKSINDENFNIENFKDKLIFLTFYRFASCPLCNLRINEIIKRYHEFGDDFIMVAVFNSSLKNLKSNTNHHKAPFHILADENYHYYRKYSVEQSFIKFLKETIMRFHRLILASIKGYIPFTFKGILTTIPVDILIDKNGLVVEAYYGKDKGDHLNSEKIKDFSDN